MLSFEDSARMFAIACCQKEQQIKSAGAQEARHDKVDTQQSAQIRRDERRIHRPGSTCSPPESPTEAAGRGSLLALVLATQSAQLVSVEQLCKALSALRRHLESASRAPASPPRTPGACASPGSPLASDGDVRARPPMRTHASTRAHKHVRQADCGARLRCATALRGCEAQRTSMLPAMAWACSVMALEALCSCSHRLAMLSGPGPPWRSGEWCDRGEGLR